MVQIQYNVSRHGPRQITYCNKFGISFAESQRESYNFMEYLQM